MKRKIGFCSLSNQETNHVPGPGSSRNVPPAGGFISPRGCSHHRGSWQRRWAEGSAWACPPGKAAHGGASGCGIRPGVTRAWQKPAQAGSQAPRQAPTSLPPGFEVRRETQGTESPERASLPKGLDSRSANSRRVPGRGKTPSEHPICWSHRAALSSKQQGCFWAKTTLVETPSKPPPCHTGILMPRLTLLQCFVLPPAPPHPSQDRARGRCHLRHHEAGQGRQALVATSQSQRCLPPTLVTPLAFSSSQLKKKKEEVTWSPMFIRE